MRKLYISPSPVLHVAMMAQCLLHMGVAKQGGLDRWLRPYLCLTGGGAAQCQTPLLRRMLAVPSSPTHITGDGHLHCVHIHTDRSI